MTLHSLDSDQRMQLFLVILLVLVMLLRLIGLGEYPIMDTTEARYAEISRKMLTLNDWIVPMYTHDVPFWGKPPLAFWLSASSMGIMGIGEFAARLPSWLCGLGVICLLYPLTGADRRRFALACIIFCSSVLGYTATGDVTTDPVLTLLVTATLVSFWLAVVERMPLAYYLGFIALGASVLAKGPVALVLTGLPVLLYLLISRQLLSFLTEARLVLGLLLTLTVSVPWYLVMEQHSHGFLEYFLIGEHFQRFVDSGWRGDLYGGGHSEPYGMIWVFAVQGMLPWSLVLVLLPFVWPRVRRAFKPIQLSLFLFLWLLSPLLLFTFSANILPTYFMPALPAAAVLLASVIIEIYDSLRQKLAQRKLLVFVIALMAMAIPLAKFLAAVNATDWYTGQRNQKPVIEIIRSDPVLSNMPIYYVGRRRFSAEFYAGGEVRYIPSVCDADLGYAMVAISDSSSEISQLPDSCRLVAHRSQYQLHRCQEAQ
jgi:4-amino-4-deoxy-L-arabinose transferase-like glycosyltransferase